MVRASRIADKRPDPQDAGRVVLEGVAHQIPLTADLDPARRNQSRRDAARDSQRKKRSFERLAERFGGLPGLLVGDVGVADGGLDVFVAEQLLDLPQILSDVIE